MATIRQDDFIDSVADALQFISYYQPLDYIEALGEAYKAEQSPAAKDAIAQILTNSRMCAEGHRPICQDTGIVVADPAGSRTNTKDNTPALVHLDIVPGGIADVKIAARGGGSENKSKFVMLNPSDSIVDWVRKTVPTMGAGWCPPGMLGIGTQGLGGLSTVLDVKILDYPTHAVSKSIESARLVAFADLGMEAIYEFGVKDMPVTVAVDANGTSVHETGPREWQQRIGNIPLTVAQAP
jgi:fumarate hydratase class I